MGDLKELQSSINTFVGSPSSDSSASKTQDSITASEYKLNQLEISILKENIPPTKTQVAAIISIKNSCKELNSRWHKSILVKINDINIQLRKAELKPI